MIGIKKDCFAYRKNEFGTEECDALTELYCAKEKRCRFYKKCKNGREERPRDGNQV